MIPPNEAWSAWVYRAAMMVLGIFSIGSMIWLHIDVAYGDWRTFKDGPHWQLSHGAYP